MIYFQTTSELLIFRIADGLNQRDMERITLLLEDSYNDGFDKEITFQVESDLPKEQMQILRDFCGRLPFKSKIDLRYPISKFQNFGEYEIREE